MKKDKLFEKQKIKDFEFDRKVASVFDDMVSGVPMYRESMDASISLADTFVSKILEFMILVVQQELY